MYTAYSRNIKCAAYNRTKSFLTAGIKDVLLITEIDVLLITGIDVLLITGRNHSLIAGIKDVLTAGI